MRKVSLFLPVLLVFIQVLGTNAVAQPKIVVATSTLNFDTLYQGQEVSRSTVVYNKGTTPLIIEHIDPSCECSVPLMKKMTLQPREKAPLTVTFDGKLYDGEVNKFLLIVSNDRPRRNTRIGIHAFVKPVLEVEPKSLHIRPPDSTGALDTAFVTLKNVTRKPLKILSVGDPSGHARGWVEGRTLFPGKTVRLCALPTGTVVLGTIGSFVLKFTKSVVRELRISYSIRAQ